jgi:GNAT superfamily N-acetyltransferase
MEFDLVETDDAAAREHVLKPLEAYNEAMTGRGQSEPFRSLSILRREDDRIGGLVGVAYWDWLHVDLLYLPEAWRRGGTGARLIAACMGFAARHGLEGVWLGSFSFQAPGFYRRQGFTEFAVLPDHPPGFSDHVFLRRVRGDEAEVELPAGFRLTDEVTPADRLALGTGLRAFNDGAAGPSRRQPLGLKLPGGGGLWGESSRGWLFVELLGIPEAARGDGVGTRLMREAERIAASRGCIGVHLDTCSFQAPGFYEKLGYTRFGTVPDHPRGFARHLYARRLDGGPLLPHNAPPPRALGASE